MKKAQFLAGSIERAMVFPNIGREGPTEEGGRHVLSVHIETIPLPKGSVFRGRVQHGKRTLRFSITVPVWIIVPVPIMVPLWITVTVPIVVPV